MVEGIIEDYKLTKKGEKRLSDLVPVMANRLVKSNSFLSSNRSIEENLDFELEDMFKRNPDLNSLQRDAFTAAVELAKRILKERLNCRATAIDISKKALNIAEFNAKMQQLKNRIKFINSDVDKFFAYKFDAEIGILFKILL